MTHVLDQIRLWLVDFGWTNALAVLTLGSLALRSGKVARWAWRTATWLPRSMYAVAKRPRLTEEERLAKRHAKTRSKADQLIIIDEAQGVSQETSDKLSGLIRNNVSWGNRSNGIQMPKVKPPKGSNPLLRPPAPPRPKPDADDAVYASLGPGVNAQIHAIGTKYGIFEINTWRETCDKTISDCKRLGCWPTFGGNQMDENSRCIFVLGDERCGYGRAESENPLGNLREMGMAAGVSMQEMADALRTHTEPQLARQSIEKFAKEVHDSTLEPPPLEGTTTFGFGKEPEL